MSQKFFTTSDVARMCNVHRNTIIGAIRKGQLKIYRTPGGHARISEEDFLEFCKKRGLPVNLGRRRNDKVLLVDDDPLLVRLMRAGLEKAKYRVMAATNGYDAGFLTLEWKPDVLLLDIMLPDLQGDAVARRIRDSELTHGLPIIAISAVTDEAKIQAMYEAGVNDFLSKPFEVAELRNRIVKLIGPLNDDVPLESDTGVGLELPVAAERA